MARDQEKEDSVFDFLYIDSRRIALFLSQFDAYGHLKALTRSVSENAKTGGGIDLKLAKIDYSDGSDSSVKKEYDAQWVAPLTFLDTADQRGLIERDITKARIGRLVLLSGRLSMLDMAMLKGAWEMPAIRQQIQSGVTPTAPLSRAQRRRGEAATPVPGVDMILGLLKLWPHVTQVMLAGNGMTAWGTIRDDGLITPAGDLILKHGVGIAGTWSVVGVLDATPELNPITDPNQAVQAAMAAPTVPSLVGTLFEALSPLTRQALGRPPSAYGVTPLLIFRDVTA
jgi:hypothetical protein